MTLTHKTKLAYGIGDLGTAITANLVAFFLLIFLTDTAKVAPALAGAILLVANSGMPSMTRSWVGCQIRPAVGGADSAVQHLPTPSPPS